MATFTTELRNLSPKHVHELAQILAVNKEWKTVMGAIPDPDDPTRSKLRFNTHHITVIEEASTSSPKPAFEILVNEWGTMGRKRPSVGSLLHVCLKVEALRAASYINEKILKRAPIMSVNPDLVTEVAHELSEPMSPRTVRALEEQLEHDMLLEDGNLSDLDDNSDVLTMPLANENAFEVPSVPVCYLASITADFGANDGRRLIGSGGFADVFLGVTRRSSRRLAVKRLKTFDGSGADCTIFDYEVGELSRLKHKHIIAILGYSNDDPTQPCLVYPFMKNGTLERKLRVSGEGALIAKQRVSLAFGVAQALEFLHSRPKPLIHRDVKTSNILLDDDLMPKIADFGLLRHASKGQTETVNVKGTPHYMAPEAMRGDISIKIDVYSFGAVLLEIVTGLEPVDDDRENRDIITHVQDELQTGQMKDLLDPRAKWEVKVGEGVFNLALECLYDKPKRPYIKTVCDSLSKFLKS